jgi:hypothetical protein
MSNKKPLWSLLQPQMQAPLMTPADPEMAKQQEMMLAMNQPDAAMNPELPQQPQFTPQLKPTSRTVEYKVPAPNPSGVPQYEKQFDDAFFASMDQRKNALDALKQKLGQAETSAPTGLDAVDLRPFLMHADNLMGTKNSYAYQGNQAVKDSKDQVQRLQEAVQKDSNQLSDDQLNYLKVKAQEEGMKIRETEASKRLSAALGRQTQNNEFKLRNEWDSDPITKNTKTIMEGYQKIVGAAKGDSKASDLSMIYGIMRLQDPGSVVREREADMAAAIGGWPAQTQAWFQNVQGKGKLTPEQRAEIRKEAEMLMRAQVARQGEVDKKYKSMASEYGFSPNRVVLSEIFNQTSTPGDSRGPKVGTVVDGMKFMGGDPNSPSSWIEVK